ncbi:MAG TPA: GntR family transcriptional regulator [Thermotogota bacterium]|nr:GntR family transcriptional regulator [Thermotogota bacterium]HRW92743.1 GntR family transcriptional regulator [Thermotogota bacterium]
MLISISNANPDPLYRQVSEQIKEAIVSGQLAPGTQLPSVRQLAMELQISVITIKRSYSDLESEGFLFSRAGQGTFVSNIQPSDVAEQKREEIKQRLRKLLQEANKFGISRETLVTLLQECEVEE